MMMFGSMYLVWLKRIVSYCILDLAFANISYVLRAWFVDHGGSRIRSKAETPN